MMTRKYSDRLKFADADGVGYDAFDGAYRSHLNSAAPSGANNDEGFRCSHGKVYGERNDGCPNEDRHSTHERNMGGWGWKRQRWWTAHPK